ncbi:hypothetical protein FVE85_8784 [Porphyridium purpureum]|uniref:Uncharacterized protein n=1 Tax=Porphyridium purpureum TaxID=35688 RepID=A0A5J4YPH4_PORPP|nr:hypothetical protein FVE85_8784 [Porphyridium purpureum]|eukprot:POR1187..scf296_7
MDAPAPIALVRPCHAFWVELLSAPNPFSIPRRADAAGSISVATQGPSRLDPISAVAAGARVRLHCFRSVADWFQMRMATNVGPQTPATKTRPFMLQRQRVISQNARCNCNSVLELFAIHPLGSGRAPLRLIAQRISVVDG